ncbi:MAG: PIN domain-containing protein, partial [Armatimonadetes bacterium]|nr:PIN domain-containing protein [Armatimonadota bacterium]
LPNLYIVDVVSEDALRMAEAMARFLLRPRDALHYAVMERLGCLKIASTDAHFDRVPSITRYAP